MLGFLAFFALMSFAAYGLVVHQGRPEDRHAGRVYIALVIVGELLLFTAAVTAGYHAGGTDFSTLRQMLATGSAPPWLLLLFVVGFGIKLGLVPLHVWLPLAHPAAPTPASAVLSGAMIKAGLLGLLRVLPLGEATFPDGGTTLAIFGLVAAIGAALYGATQRHPKTILAYSSVSQMGLVTICLGLGLAAPAAWPVLLTAMLALVTHHALAKGALFLGVGVADADWGSVRQCRWIGGLLAIAGLALAGLPLTGGAAAKVAVKAAVADSGVPLAAVLGWLLPLTGLTTGLLILRYLVAVWPRPGHGHFAPRPLLWAPWLALVAGVLALPWLGADRAWAAPKNLVAAAWPILLMLGLAWGLGRHPAWRQRLGACFPPAGDFLVVYGACWRGFQVAWRVVVTRSAEMIYRFAAAIGEQAWHRLGHGAYRATHLIERWEVVATILPLLIGLLWWLSA
jgi:formate hydrogenlyase subunit 3/multisubunit Na+/H+ antiporter MnhD subunit